MTHLHLSVQSCQTNTAFGLHVKVVSYTKLEIFQRSTLPYQPIAGYPMADYPMVDYPTAYHPMGGYPIGGHPKGGSQCPDVPHGTPISAVRRHDRNLCASSRFGFFLLSISVISFRLSISLFFFHCSTHRIQSLPHFASPTFRNILFQHRRLAPPFSTDARFSHFLISASQPRSRRVYPGNHFEF